MRGGQRRLVRPRRSTHSSGCAHGLLLRLPCFLLHPCLSLSFSSQGWCPPPRLRGPGRPTEVTPATHQPRPLAHVRAPKVQRWVQVQVHQMLALLVPQAPSSRRCPPSLCPYSPFLLIYDRSRRTGCTARGCCRYAETVCLLLPESFIVISTLCFCCASPAACCWCRVPAACF